LPRAFPVERFQPSGVNPEQLERLQLK
jgi:hypothetical protein